MSMIRALLLSLSSSLIFALGLPNELYHYGSPLLGYLALAPLYLALSRTRGYGKAALLCGLYGGLHHALSSYWLYFFKGFAFWTIGVTTLTYVVIYAVLGLYLSFFLRRSGPLRPLAFALLWTIFEHGKSTGFLGYPWGLLPYTQTEVLPLLQIADATGVYGLSFLLAYLNGALAESLSEPDRTLAALACLLRRSGGPRGVARLGPDRSRGPTPSHLAAALLLMALAGLYGRLRLSEPLESRGALRALLVQQNVDPWYDGEEAALLANILPARKELAAVKAAGEPVPDLILFSETSLKRPYLDFLPYFEQRPVAAPLGHFIRESGTYLFTGAPIVLDWESFQATNSVILIDPQGRQVEDYAKIHPVPFAEAIPFWEYEGFRTFMREKVGLDQGWVMGEDYTVFKLPTRLGEVRFGAPICFEDAFPEVCAEFFRGGADLLVNLTNDAWSKTVSAEIQHYAAARFRSIEFRKPMIRSTNGGLSCVIDARGRLVEALPLFATTARIVEVPLERAAGPTFYERFGDWFPRLALLLCAAWAIILIAGRKPEKEVGE